MILSVNEKLKASLMKHNIKIMKDIKCQISSYGNKDQQQIHKKVLRNLLFS